MSASRDVIARVAGVPEEMCDCRHCARHSEFINDMLWCIGWSSQTRASSFCSMFVPEGAFNIDTEADS